ncbi:hypothetical protein G6O69_31855 [Pseudenhygromyxa sp. WMMC2535]|uniref:ATP-binding protein n=1 Tax=Pseudenhygromyxa sp. WMMC2535 TaxID=2712867 RepID=UPI0015954779|nr:ATP-binding protein [Pseudenhygromyxa sp. WMMC2535]NVB42462.1 hypothetical protein [Pseudenhygromyxa sp. WMMC2535]
MEHDGEDARGCRHHAAVAGVPAMPEHFVSGALQLLIEIIDNVIDLHLAGLASRLRVSMAHDHFCVADDGPGIRDEALVAAATRRMTRRACDRVHVHLRGVGLGLSGVNGLAQRLEIEVRRAQEQRRWVFEGGQLRARAELLGGCEGTGTCVRVWPEASERGVELPTRRDVEALLERVHWLCPSLRVEFDGRRLADEAGLGAWIRRQPCWDGSTVHTRGATWEQQRVELAWSWLRPACRPAQIGFVNLFQIATGSHLDGLVDGLAARHGVGRTVAREHGLALISLLSTTPRVVGSSPRRLDDPQLRCRIAEMIYSAH